MVGRERRRFKFGGLFEPAKTGFDGLVREFFAAEMLPPVKFPNKRVGIGQELER